MELLPQILINTLITGSIYGIVAMGFTLAYKTTRFFNLAHGVMAAIGGYSFFFLNHELGITIFISLPISVLFAGLVGFLVDRVIYAPQRRRKATGTVLLVVSLGVMTVIESILAMIFTTQFRSLTDINDIQVYEIGSASITQVQIFIVMANIVILLGLLLLMYRTKFGQLLRAISDDESVARILGIRTNLYIGWVFFVAAVLAGFTGILVGLDTGLKPTMGFYLLLKAIIAAIIGCMGSIPGAFLGSFLLSGVENASVWALASEWKDAVAFVLLLIFLVFKPEGILGKNRKN